MLRKTCSWIVMLTFCIVNMSDYSIAYSPAFAVRDIQAILPQSTGTVQEKFQGKGDALVYYIPDLHCHAGAQYNITGIIEKIKSIHKKECGFVGIEGTRGNLDTSLFDVIKNEEEKKKLIKNLVNKGDLSGAEGYGVLNDDVQLYGLEDKSTYMKNFEVLLESL